MKGQSLVEFGISLVVLIFLLAGLVEFGVIFFQYVQLRDAAQEGALYGATCGNCTVADIANRAVSSSGTPIDLLTDPNISVEVMAKSKSGSPKDPELACEGDAMTVRVSYTHRIFMPFIPQLLDATHVNLNGIVVDTVLVPICQ
jgi:Flp pilus assembly protein TadG